MAIKEEILKCLIETYCGRDSFYNPAKRGQKIILERRNKLFDPYRHTLEIEDEVRFLEARGFVFVTRHDNGFTAIELNKDEEAIRASLEYLGMEDPRIDIAKQLELLYAHKGLGTVVGRFCEAMIGKTEGRKPTTSDYYKDSAELKKLLLAVEAICALKEETLFRSLSMSLFGSSKELEKMEGKLVHLFREFDGPYEEDEDPLMAHGLAKNPTMVLLKGKVKFSCFGQVIDLASWNGQFGINNEAIATFRPISLGASKIITIENLTSFTAFEDEDALIIYLAGFHDKAKKHLLETLHQAFPSTPFYHFGDMDAGGFAIFHRLCLDTGIPFIPYQMDIASYEMASLFALPLKESDRKRLKMQLEEPSFGVFHPLIKRMLLDDRKVEQESFIAVNLTP